MKKLATLGLSLYCFSALCALKVETFNTGLAKGFVDHAPERIGHVVEAIKNSDADIICLQEVWSLSDRAFFEKELKEEFKEVFSTSVYQTTTSSRPSCKPWEIFGKGKFVSCMQSQCSGLPDDEFTDCLINQCGESLERLKRDNRECASALMAKVGQNPILSVLQLINPFYRSGLFAYRGSNGLMLLSKLELKNKEVLDFSDISTLNRRQALKAQIEFQDEPTQVICSHLTAVLNVPYTGTSKNWEQENLLQAKRILESVENDRRAIVMGDFNCGHEDSAGDLSSEAPDTCSLLQGRLQDPLASLSRCTYCSSNLINRRSGETQSKLLDHIFIKGLLPSNPNIVYDQEFEIEVDGERLKTNLSDHYGASVTIE